MPGWGRLELRGPLVREDMRGRGSGVRGAWLGRDVGRRGKEGRGTISFLNDVTLFCESKKDFLGCLFWDGTFEICRDVHRAERAIHLGVEVRGKIRARERKKRENGDQTRYKVCVACHILG